MTARLGDPDGRSRARAVRRVALWLSVILALVAASGSVAVGADPPKKPIVRSPEFTQAVNRAIALGVGWLRKVEGDEGRVGFTIKPYDTPGHVGGTVALATYTLRVCGTPRDDPKVKAELDWLKSTFYAQRERGELRTYTVALMCMAAGEPDPPPPAQPPGATTARPAATKPSRADAKWLQDMADWLARAQSPSGAWSYVENPNSTDGSNTQYALLGLRAAARGGAAVRERSWRKALDYYLDAQSRAAKNAAAAADELPGGWGYRDRSKPYGSMTASGVAGVRICAEALRSARQMPEQLAARCDRAVADGVAWLGAKFSVPENPDRRTNPHGGPVEEFQYLYAVERAGVLAGTEWLGAHDWYGMGAWWLVSHQLPCGAFTSQHADPSFDAIGGDVERGLLVTCFALLFLRKGTLPAGPAAAVTGSPAAGDLDFSAAGSLSDPDFDAFVVLVLERARKAADDATRAVLLDRATALGPRILPQVIRRLAAADRADRSAAITLLRRALGKDLGFDPDDTAPDRDAAIARWQTWLHGHSDRLTYDAAAGRIVERGDQR